MLPTSEAPYQIIKGDALEIMRGLPDNSINLIATDPPYYKVKDEQWDRQWETPEGFLSWMDELAQEWQRILKPNGSLYVFASPQMAYHVEGVIRKYFNVLNHVIWQKEGGTRANQADKEILRQYFGNSERVIFAEQNGFRFSSLRDYMLSELEKAKTNPAILRQKLGYPSNVAHNWFSVSGSDGAINCWGLPTIDDYKLLQKITGFFSRDYYELRKEYEQLRRPFNGSPDVQFVDVWNFETVQGYTGKHPCEKPAPMMEHIVSMSSNPDDIVLDCFMGSGATGAACGKLGRKFIGVDSSEKYYRKAYQRIVTAYRHFEKLGDVGKLSASSFEGLPLFNNGGG